MNAKTRRFGARVGLAALLLALAGTPFAVRGLHAQGPGGPGGPRMFGRGGPGGPLAPMMLGRLDLSDAQRDQVKAIVDSHRAEEQAVADRARTARKALDAAITATGLNEAAVRTAAADVAAVDADAAVVRARVYSEIFQVLTADQQNELKKQQAAMQERMDKMQANREQRRR